MLSGPCREHSPIQKEIHMMNGPGEKEELEIESTLNQDIISSAQFVGGLIKNKNNKGYKYHSVVSSPHSQEKQSRRSKAGRYKTSAQSPKN